MAYARYSIDRLVQKDGVSFAQPIALYLLSNDGLRVLQPYTRDPTAIDAALRAHGPVLPWRLQQQNIDFSYERINRSLTALQQIAIANTGVPGHKNIVWISPGIPILSDLQLSGEGQKKLFDALRRLSNQLLKARISVYSVDPRGVESAVAFLARLRGSSAQSSFPGSPTNSLEFAAYLNALSQAHEIAFGNLAIQTLATQTGGHAFFGRNDVDREIATSLAEGNSYYTLAYAPSNHNFDGKFRKIAVSVINRPDLKVQTRAGYYAMPEGQTPDPKRKVQELVMSLLTPIPFNGVPIPVSYAKLLDGSRISVRFAMPSTSLSWTEGATGKLSAKVTVAAARKDKHGTWNPQFARVYDVELPEGATPSSTVLGTVSFEAPYHNSDRVRIVVRDEASGRIGSAEIDLRSLKAGGS
jgi:VWFA-related protein